METSKAEITKVQDPFDLYNLRYRESILIKEQKKTISLVPGSVMEVVEKINALPSNDNREIVIWIWTGGTVSMSQWSSGALEPDLDFQSIMNKSDARLKNDFAIVWLDAYKTDSSQLEIDDVWDLAIAMAYVWQNMNKDKQKRFAGFLIVHWTDTMPKSWAHLAMMLGNNMPFNVVHTWAQKPINAKINDAQTNIIHSFNTLKMLYKGGFAECLTVMWWLTLLTCGITKISDHNARAMDTLMHGHIIDFSDLPDPDIDSLPEYLRKKPDNDFDPIVYRWPNRIGEINAEMQEDEDALIAQIRHSNRKAVLLVAYWANTFDLKALRTIWKEVTENNVLAFAISPINVDPKLDIYAAGEEMVREWVIPLFMTKEAARAKLMRLFAKYWDDIKSIKREMVSNFIWEIPTKESKKVA